MKPEILIVEDDLIIAETVKADLLEADYHVVGVCQSGEEALEVVEKSLPDLLLMDIKLEGKLDGIQVSERILKKYRVPIIYLTDVTARETVKEAISTRPSSYLVKPFQTHQLLIAVEAALFNGNSEYLGNKAGYFRQDKEHIKVVYKDIIFLKAGGAYCEVHTSKGEKILLTKSLNQVLKKIPCTDLIRVHKSYCINKNYVDKLMGKMLYVGNERIKIGETYEHVLAEHFDII